MKFHKIRIGVDAGSSKSGIVVIEENGIREGYNIDNGEVFSFLITERNKCEEMNLVIEDVRPYNMRITNGIIETIKFLGELEYRLKEAGITFTLIARWEVKKWVYDKFNQVSVEEIIKNISRHDAREQKKSQLRGEVYKPKSRSVTFVYVDDPLIVKVMREYWSIERKKGFAQKAKYNLKDHAWQALALLTYAMTDYNTASDILPVP